MKGLTIATFVESCTIMLALWQQIFFLDLLASIQAKQKFLKITHLPVLLYPRTELRKSKFFQDSIAITERLQHCNV
jgi:hypothetical protein